MRFLITGATGFLGRHLAAALRERNEVVVLARDPDKAAKVVPGARVVVWNGNVGLPPAEAFDGVDVVVNLIGESIAGRWTEKRKRLARDSRLLPTRALIERMAGLTARPRVFLSMSGSAIYGDRGEEILTESSALGTTPRFLVKLATEWEAAAHGAEALGVRVVLLRAGVVLGRDGGILSKLLLPFRMGLGGRLGSGKQYFPWIHIADAVGIVLHAAERGDLNGPVNLVAPEPVTNAEFTDRLSVALGRTARLAVPAFALKMALGDMAEEMLLSGQRMSPSRALQSGYEFRYPLLQDALRDVLRAPETDSPRPPRMPNPSSPEATGTQPP
jgi:uncharacterized protein (TIGR01777 family)